MFNVVAQEEQFIIVNKAPGTSFHCEGGREKDCEENTSQVGLLTQVREVMGTPDLYPVHRLDRMTSGLLVMAKTPEANRQLSMQFQSREVEKYYLAVSARKPKKKQGTVKGDMASSRRGSWKLLSSTQNPAVTQFVSCGIGNGLRLFLLKPLTGKTHQIRVAMKSLGASILGDPLYGNECRHHLDRGYLHAYVLGFHFNGDFYRYVLAPDQGVHFSGDSFNRAMNGYRAPWNLPWKRVSSIDSLATPPVQVVS